MNDNDYLESLLKIGSKDYLTQKWEWDVNNTLKAEDLLKIVNDYSNWEKDDGWWYEDAITNKKKSIPKKPVETNEQKVIRILKGDFEKKFGMTFEKFIETYNGILENSPEKLI